MRDDYDRHGKRVGLQADDYALYGVCCVLLAIVILLC